SPRGVSYNSYLVKDEKTVLLDTVDKSVGQVFFENLEYLLKDTELDYIIVNHMEPDHSHTLGELVLRYPNAKIVANKKTIAMIKQFFNFDVESRAMIVNEGDTLNIGKRTFTFVFAPMVHWPEVMVSYETHEKILFSADAFGSFGAINGNLFADEVDFDRDWLEDARRYYANIVGKYGVQTKMLLDKMSKIEVNMVCPLHGLIWRKNIDYFVEKYQRWSSYTPEENSALIVYASIYGNTENAVNILAGALADKGIKKIAVYDVSITNADIIVSESFRYSHIVFASTTYNGGIFIKMEEALMDIKAHNLQNRTAAIIENGSWAPTSGKLMREIISSLKGWEILDDTITITSALKQDQTDKLHKLADKIFNSIINSKIK
ncbi:MAG: FprA family A-type flavoprotein, partial [Elusimicrobiota bacterium]|nr:FprA family A-type flavoprotein [Elusimicrobiota bacterium]